MKVLDKIITLTIILLLCFSCNVSKKDVVEDIPEIKQPEYKYARQMAETVLEEYPDIWSIEDSNQPKWTYTFGLVAKAMIDLYEQTNNKDYLNYAIKYVDALIDENGIIKTYKKEDYNIDKLNSGKVLFPLFELTKDQRYKTAIDTLRVQIKEHPRTEIGGFWHKQRYPHQMWLDGLYMGGPFYAQYALVNNETESFDEIAEWYKNMEMVARDPATGLLYHAWDESKEQAWANKETGLSPCFWGRAMGWYSMALVDLLDYFPKDHAAYNDILQIISRTAEAIVKIQDSETGIWYQVLDQGEREGNYLEGSVSCMFSYFLLKAINKGYLDKEKYEASAKKAFTGTVENLVTIKDDSTLVISPVCAVAGLGGEPYRDGTYKYYISEKKRDNDPKAVGPFIMAAIQYELLFQ